MSGSKQCPLGQYEEKLPQLKDEAWAADLDPILKSTDCETWREGVTKGIWEPSLGVGLLRDVFRQLRENQLIQ